jgi:predicted nucleotidyltransferase
MLVCAFRAGIKQEVVQVIITERILRDTLLIDEHDGDAYVLYGSYARGDYEASSDVDIMRITTCRMQAPRLNGHVLLHIYDIKDLLEMAKQGSLFILHLIREAKPIIDPSNYMAKLSAAFQKPASYELASREMLAHASTLLDVDESLFSNAGHRFMDVAIFLCRTLVYAEHADRGAFSFSMRSLATDDKVAAMVCDIKDHSSSYSDFQRIRQAIREKVRLNGKRSDASSMDDLGERSKGDPLFDSLLRRIVESPAGDGYVLPPEVASNESSPRSMAEHS